MNTAHPATTGSTPIKKSKLESFSLSFEYNRTLHEERQKTKQRTTDKH